MSAPWRRDFDTARDPYAARNALGITGASAGALGFATSADFPAGAWTAWTPTISSGSGTITSSTVNRARYIQLGKTIIANLIVTITNAGTGSGHLIFTLPVAASASGGGTVHGQEYAISGFSVAGIILPSDTTGFILAYNASTPVATNMLYGITAIYECA